MNALLSVVQRDARLLSEDFDQVLVVLGKHTPCGDTPRGRIKRNQYVMRDAREDINAQKVKSCVKYVKIGIKRDAQSCADLTACDSPRAKLGQET